MKAKDLLFPGTAMRRRATQRNQARPPDQQLYARFAPGSARAIRVYASGHLESPWGSGHLQDAHASLEPAFKQLVLTITGPHINVVASFSAKVPMLVKDAHRFVNRVNRLAEQL